MYVRDKFISPTGTQSHPSKCIDHKCSTGLWRLPPVLDTRDTTNVPRNMYLPVYLGEEPVYLDSSKLISRKPILDLLNCEEVFPPIFEATNGNLVQAAPSVQSIQL